VLGEHRGQERNLRNTLLTAQKHRRRRQGARADRGRLIIREAEGQRDLLLQKAQARLEDVQREIEALRMKRREVENDIESLIRTLNSTLEFIRDQDAASRDERSCCTAAAAELPRGRSTRAAGIVPKADTGRRFRFQISDSEIVDLRLGHSSRGPSGFGGLRDGVLCQARGARRRRRQRRARSRSSPSPHIPKRDITSSRANARVASASGSPASIASRRSQD
jgi:hypothetical protein